MMTDKGTIWGGAVGFDAPAPSTLKASLEKGLERFASGQNDLLAELAAARRSPLAEPAKAWRQLEGAAHTFLWREAMLRIARADREEMSIPERVRRLEKIAESLGNARRLIGELPADAAVDLAGAWWDLDTLRSPGLYDVEAEFDRTVRALEELEAGARSAAETVHAAGGRLPSAILPAGTVIALASIFRDHAGRLPSTSREGAFFRVVMSFLTALDKSLSEDQVTDTVKAVRKAALDAPSKWDTSPLFRE